MESINQFFEETKLLLFEVIFINYKKNFDLYSKINLI